eukprot:scaffold4797_cov90-Skeletonema_dohrnii-CCMP3373.AAC.4
MIVPFVTKAAVQSAAALPQSPAAFIAAIPRGGAAAAAAAFDMGLAKTRLEGLAYGTVTALITSAALNLFKYADGENSKLMANDRFNNIIKITLGILLASCVALGIYTTAIFTIIGIYSKTALGMGQTTDFITFFNSCEKFRHYGFRSFVACLASFSISWVCALLLTYEEETRWWIALPAILVGVMGFLHYKELFALASTLIYSSSCDM